MSRIPGGYTVRHAVVLHKYDTEVECQYLDRPGEHNPHCPVPHPYAGPNGSGIFVGIEEGTRVLIAYAPQEIPYIVGIVPDHGSYFDQGGSSDSSVDNSSYPNVSDGELSLKGPSSVQIDLYDGGISINGQTSDSSDLELSQLSKALYVRSNNVYSFSEAGRTIEGVVKRDVSTSEDPSDTNTVNFLDSEDYEYLLSEIGRCPEDEVSLRSTQVSKTTIRNPSLVERRDITYEFADSFGVRDITSEANATAFIRQTDIDAAVSSDSFSNIVVDPSYRENRRTDTLDLNLRNYNHLIEKTEGTVVDIYGNILDLNRSIIDIPELKTISSSGKKITEDISRMYAFLRRSIKYHFEINSRKDLKTPDIAKKQTSYNSTEYSRWGIDVDGEGLTKINIPASSETGNIPVLGRYIVSRDTSKPEITSKLNSGSFRDPEGIDIRLLPFGYSESSNGKNNIVGQNISDNSYEPVLVPDGYIDGYTSVGTAHHNILTIAQSIFHNGKLKIPNSYPYTYPWPISPSVGPVADKINNQISPIQPDGTYQTNPDANAGGRSLNTNLDGSAEISIGADTADRKSLVLDTAGGIISHYGRDRNGRSIISQTDGDVIIQVGSQGISGDDRFKSPDDTADRPGRVEIHLNNPNGANSMIIIDEKGMTININGNIVLSSTGDFSISAGANLLLAGTNIYTHGVADTSVNGDRNIDIKKTERFINRSGRNNS